jgi:hypothetical protein
MTEWNPELFSTSVSIPCIKIQPELIGKAQNTLKKYCLKVRNLRSVMDVNGGKVILLNPDLVTGFNDISSEDRSILEVFGLDEQSFCFEDIDLTVDNWKSDDMKFLFVVFICGVFVFKK